MTHQRAFRTGAQDPQPRVSSFKPQSSNLNSLASSHSPQASSDHPQHVSGAARALNELFKNALIQSGCRFGFRVELSSESEPIVNLALDRFHDTIGATCRYGEAQRDFVDGHVVHAVDADLTVAIHTFHQRIGRHFQAMAMTRILTILVWQRRGKVLGNMQEQVAALLDVKQLHADADSKYRHMSFGDQTHQQAIRPFTTYV